MQSARRVSLALFARPQSNPARQHKPQHTTSTIITSHLIKHTNPKTKPIKHHINNKQTNSINKGGGEFGEVYKAKWHGSYVAAKVLKRSDEIALGDFRTEIAILR